MDFKEEFVFFKHYLRKIRIIATGVAILSLAIFLILPIKVSASSETVDLYGRLKKDVGKVNEFIDYADNTKDDTDTMIAKLLGYKSYFQESSKFYEGLANSTEQKIATGAKQSKDNANSLAENIGQISDALKNKDEGKYNSSITKINSTIDNYNKTISDLNEGALDYGPIYIFATIFFSLVSFILLIKAKTKPRFNSEIPKKQCEMELFKASLWPTGGSVITLVWFKLTPPGGTYYILWGPILIGLIYFIKQYWTYVREVRPKLIKMIEQEKEETTRKKQIEEESSYCSNCGDELMVGDKFCKSCGSKIN